MILAADFGGTAIKLGIVQNGNASMRLRLEARADRPMTERLEAVAGAWEQMLKESGSSLRHCHGTALSLPFLADPKRSRVRGQFGKFPGAEVIDFSAWSEERLGLPTALEGDLRVAVLGEWAAGAARGMANVVMLAIGTGIGCAVISENQLLRGANNRAATLMGHLTVDYRGSPGRCGNIGCAEDLASTATLAERAQSQPDFIGSALARAEKIDLETLFRLAAQGDACSGSILSHALEVWAAVLQNAILAYDPEIVILGGGVMRSSGVVLAAMERHLRRHMAGVTLDVPVVAGDLGDDAALIGAEVLFRQTHPHAFRESV